MTPRPLHTNPETTAPIFTHTGAKISYKMLRSDPLLLPPPTPPSVLKDTGVVCAGFRNRCVALKNTTLSPQQAGRIFTDVNKQPFEFGRGLLPGVESKLE